MINLLGQKLKKSDIDGVLSALPYASVVVKTDMVGFSVFVNEYKGWFHPPSESAGEVFTNGVHPLGIGVMVVSSNDAPAGMQFLESIGDPSVIEEITNYT